MHHSREEFDAKRPRIIEELAKQLNLGATGRYPEGHLTKQDEGELKLAVGVHDGKVVVNFGTPVTWLGLTPPQARELAESIRKHSYKAEGG